MAIEKKGLPVGPPTAFGFGCNMLNDQYEGAQAT